MILISRKETMWPGIIEEWYAHADGRMTIRRVQDVAPHIAENARRRNHLSAKSRKNYGEGLGVQVANLPYSFVEEYLQETSINLMTCGEKQLNQLLNNSEFNKLRTDHGRL